MSQLTPHSYTSLYYRYDYYYYYYYFTALKQSNFCVLFWKNAFLLNTKGSVSSPLVTSHYWEMVMQECFTLVGVKNEELSKMGVLLFLGDSVTDEST